VALVGPQTEADGAPEDELSTSVIHLHLPPEGAPERRSRDVIEYGGKERKN
jgi:hypothetical protein